MAMTNVDKNLTIASMERSIQDAKEAAGVATLAEVETEVDGLRTAFTADPAGVTDLQIAEAAQKLENLVFPSVDDVSSVFAEADEALPAE